MNILKKIGNKWIVIGIFMIFFILMLIQHKYIGIYHDDYEYFSLAYSYEVEEVQGHNYTFLQMFEFLVGHYIKWGGRILAIAVQLTIFKIGGIEFLKFVQVCILTFILVFIYLITSRYLKSDKGKIILALFIVSTYGMIDIHILRNGTYWFVASALYVFPLLWMFMFIYFYGNYLNKKFKTNIAKILYLSFCGICLFFASFSQEQIGAMVFLYIVAKNIVHYIKYKKISKIDIFMLVISSIGFGILMFAPGNERRKYHHTSNGFYESPFFKRTLGNIPEIILGNLAEFSNYYVFILFIFEIVVAIICIKEKIGKKEIHILSIISAMIICLGTVGLSNGYFRTIYDYISNNMYKFFIISIYFIQIMLLLYSFSIYLYKVYNIFPVIILFCGIASQVVMVMAPYFTERCTIPLVYVIFLIYSYILVDILNRYYKFDFKYILNCIVISITIISFGIMFKNIFGYRKNYKAMLYNEQKLTEASIAIKSGKNINRIELMDYPSKLYAGELPNDYDNKYIYSWIKDYYDIPNNVELILKSE